jgi:hypothetical protein
MASASTTEALVAPLVRLWRSANDAKMRLRLPRALELFERALVLAETTMLESTLLATQLLQQIITTRISLAVGGSAACTDLAGRVLLYKAAWRDDEQLLRLSQRWLGLLRARWAAGTLLTPTPEEACFAECFGRTAASLGVESSVAWAYSALLNWPQEAALTLAEGAQCLHGVYDALCAAVEMWTRDLGCNESILSLLDDVLDIALHAAGPWLPRLRDTCGLSHADETKLRNLLHTVAQGQSARQERGDGALAAFDARAAADMARCRPALLRAAGLRRHGGVPQDVQAVRPLPRCRLLLRRAQQGGLEAPQAGGRLRRASLTQTQHTTANAMPDTRTRGTIRAQPCVAQTVVRCTALQP